MAGLMVSVWLWDVCHFNGLWMVSGYFGNGPVDVIAAFGGTYIVYLMSTYISRFMPRLSYWLAYFGRYSLILLCIHLIELNVIPLWVLSEPVGALLDYPFLTFVVIKFIFCFGLTFLISRSQYAIKCFGMS